MQAGRITQRRGSGGSGRVGFGVLAALIAAFLTIGLVVILPNAPLGWDESTYAQRARDLSRQTSPGIYWGTVRAPGLPILIHLLPFGTRTESALRVVTLMFGALGIVLTWLLARQLLGWRSATVAAILLTLTPRYLQTATLVVPDIPGAVLGLGTLTLLMMAARADSVRWSAIWILPLSVLATCVRFGAPIPIAIGLGVIVLARWAAVRNSLALVTVSMALTSAAMAAVLVIPQLTGSSRSPFLSIMSLVDKASKPWWQSFVDLFRGLFVYLGYPGLGEPALYLGFVTLGFFILAAFTTVRRVVRKPQEGPAVALALGIAGSTWLALAILLPHGEHRYLSPVIPLICIGVAPGGWAVFSRLGKRLRKAVVAALVLIGLLHVTLINVRQTRKLFRFYSYIRDAGTELGATLPEDCAIITNERLPQMTFYSGRTTVQFPFSEDDRDLMEKFEQLVHALPEDNVVVTLMASSHRRPFPLWPSLERASKVVTTSLRKATPDFTLHSSAQSGRKVEVYVVRGTAELELRAAEVNSGHRLD